jgi:hypothetical protein
MLPMIFCVASAAVERHHTYTRLKNWIDAVEGRLAAEVDSFTSILKAFINTSCFMDISDRRYPSFLPPYKKYL